MLFLIFATLAVSALGQLPSPSRPCPFGWALYRPADECYKVWPSNNWNNSVKVKITYDDAVAFCATQQALLPIVQNRTQMTWLLNLMGPKTGTTAWLGIRDFPGNAKPPQQWRTNTGRPFTEFFDWDTKQSMPGPEPCAAIQTGGDLSQRIPGGNNKMITVDCYERLSVVCVRQRVAVSINGVNFTSSGVIQTVWKQPLTLQILGGRIPRGTLVTLQTTNENFFSGPPRQPTQCSVIKPLVGDSTLVRLNVSSAFVRSRICNGTCQVATATWPSSTPFVRGALYSLCFYVPIPFARFKSLREFGFNWLPNIAIEVVQKRSEYLQDVCTRHQQDVNLFLGATRRSDRGRPVVRPYYFDSGAAPF